MSALDSFKDILVYAFAGVAIILLLIVFVYAFAVLVDRISCLNASADVLTPYELEERRTATSLMKRANIAGILAEERVRVFRAFFEKRSMPYHKPKDDTTEQKATAEAGHDIEAPKDSTVKTRQPKSCSKDDAKGGSATKTANADGEEVEKTVSSEDGNDDPDDAADKTCPICLNEYGKTSLNSHRVLLLCIDDRCLSLT